MTIGEWEKINIYTQKFFEYNSELNYMYNDQKYKSPNGTEIRYLACRPRAIVIIQPSNNI